LDDPVLRAHRIAKMNARLFPWCPPEWLGTYKKLVDKVGSAEAKELTLKEVERWRKKR
jgi:hypothetical protein